jgi:tripartite-type tricarboxylate transporter receptor subunit TctC
MKPGFTLPLAALLLSFAATAYGAEQPYPARPIRVIIPTAPGGGSDVMVRMLGQRFTEAWGQQVVVDHRAGGGMTIGINLTATAAPDGYTMAVVNPSHAINATLMPKLPYDPLRDLTALTVLATQPYAFCVTNSLPVKNVKELIAYAKTKPGELNAANSGPGSASHLAAEMFTSMSGVKITHVPFKGTGGAMPDLVAGRVHFYINPMLAMISQIQAGRIRLIAVTSPQRVAPMPDVPTVAESGVPGYQATSWYMIILPSKTPAPIMSKLLAETVKALKSKEFIDLLAKGGSEPVANTPKEAAEFLKAEIARWGKVIRDAKVTVQG